MEYCNLASSSEGNVSYIAYDSTKILIDCGKNLRYIENALSRLGTSSREIDTIFISHEHADHVSALPKFLSISDCLLYISMQSYLAMSPQLEGLDENRIRIIEERSEINHKSLKIKTFDVSHDAARTLAFTIEGNSKMALFTDLGYFDYELINELKDIKLLVMESNYDDDMLLSGPYPPFLKKRIRSDRGHLSNKDAAAALTEIFNRYGPSYIYLAHLSKQNNLPWLALQETEAALSAKGVINGRDVMLETLSDNRLSALLSL